jgi:deoxyadenosine/deoxycytidine kinase
VIMERIAHRARPAESGIDLEYIERLNLAYSQFVSGWDISPVISINTGAVDLREEAAVDLLAKDCITV